MTRIRPATPVPKEKKVDVLFADTDIKALISEPPTDPATPDIRSPSGPSSPALLPRSSTPALPPTLSLSLPPSSPQPLSPQPSSPQPSSPQPSSPQPTSPQPASPRSPRSRKSSRSSIDFQLTAGSSTFTFSGMELPLSLRSLMSSQVAKSQKRSASSSPRRSAGNTPRRSAGNTPERSRKRRRSSSKSDFSIESIHWDDDELVVYGREKVFSLSGYQLRMVSLLGILYAACRVLRVDLLARDIELS